MAQTPHSKVIDIEILTVAVYPRIGGMTNWMDQIAAGLARLGWRVRMLALTDKVEGYHEAPYEILHLPVDAPGRFPFPPLDRYLRWKPAFEQMQTLEPLTSTPVRLRLSDGTLGPMQAAMVRNTVQKAPWVVLHGGDVFAESANLWGSSYYHHRLRRCLKQAERIFVDGPDLIESFSHQGIDREKITLLYHGVDDSVFHPMPRRQKYFTPQEHEQNIPKIVWHGKHARYNGPLRFIDLAGQMENAAARLCGDGPQRTEVEQTLIQRGKKEWYVGPLPFEELGTFLSEGDFGLYPLREMAGVPMALVEAMSVGLPVVTTSCGACSELIEHGRTGYLCRNASEMLEIAQKLAADSSLRAMIGQAAAKTVQQNWTLEAATRKLERELKKVRSKPQTA